MDKDFFKTIDTIIRKERLYAQVNLMREDVMQRFNIGRHRLNDQLNTHADGMSFPQYINSIRMEVAYDLLTNHPEMNITEIAREVGFTAPNLREQFKRCYGITPAEYRSSLLPYDTEEEDNEL
jgi:AraC-like DNA-binding protein